ncbi:MAG TPA: hypothetical protein VHT34_12520 [Clostridia bacterium]|nr:hypothetical protein [Clostridia bacterium]
MLPPAKRYKPWTGGDYNGRIEYCLRDGRIYRAERNFENNSVKIYDSMYNDITNDFDISRERGALFAEKHLGINETCFEKTVFIRQMESRIDDDGSRELLDRLINVTQTGFEDVSFRSAQEALKEALKTYVGNDKTSTRPLDKVIFRLQELSSLKSEMLENRELTINAEKEMSNAILFRDNLLMRKEALLKVKELIETAVVLEKNLRLKAEIEELLKKINISEDETNLLKSKSSDFKKTRDELVQFSEYNENDSEAIVSDFNQMKLYENQLKNLQEEIQRKRADLKKLEIEFESVKVYGKLDQQVLDETVNVYKECEAIRKEQGKGSIADIDKKIESAGRKNNLVKYSLILSCVMSAVLLIFGIINMGSILGSVCLITAAVAFITTLFLAVAKRKAYGQLISEQNQKKISFIGINSLNEEIYKKEKVLEDTFKIVGAKGIEDFIASKSQYESKKQYIEILRTELSSLEIRSATSLAEYNSLKDKIRNVLIKVNIIDGEAEINEEYISNFKNSIRKYQGLLPGINYTVQRIKDMGADLESNYKHASKLSGIECADSDDIADFLRKLSSQIEMDEDNVMDSLNEIDKRFLNNGLTTPELGTIRKKIQSHDPESLSIDFEYELNRASEDLNSTLIQIKEYELMLKEQSNQGLDLQGIEEEMDELRIKRNTLEDINISLKLALQVLTEASDEMQKDFAPALNSKMSSIINRISSGRYTDLRADSNLALKAISPETGAVVNAVSLSGGTIDQMYLAMRISMADLIAVGNESLPLIMDEVFSQYDDTRTCETFEFLKELAEERQVIFFTCKSREIEIAGNVFGEKMNLINL